LRRINFWLTFGLLAAVLLAIPPALHAQATIPVSGNKVVDNNRQPLTGQLIFTVTDTSNTPVTYTPQGGSPTSAPFTLPVVKGAVQNIGGFPPTIANPLTMAPANTRYRIQTQSTGGGTTYFTFPLTNITTASFSYDGYIAPAGITISGAGIPTLNCNPSAMYNNTLASDPYPWVCSRLQGDAAVYWTQNPSLNPSCQRGNDQAIASAINGTTFCIDANQAYITPGFVWAGPVPGNPPTQIGLVPLTTLCSTGGCGAGATLPSNAPVFGITPLTSRAAVLGDYVSLAGTIWSGTPCTVGTNVLQVNGQCGPGGGGSTIPGTVNQAIFSAGGGAGSASNATFDSVGNFKSLSNDGLKNAFLNQTTPTSNDGIANALAVAGSIVVAGPDYAQVEGILSGNSTCVGPNWRDAIGCPAPFANNTKFYDYRQNGIGSYAYNTNVGSPSGIVSDDRWVSNQQAQASGAGNNVFTYLRDFEMTGSGKNGFDGGGPDSYVAFQWAFEFMRRGIVNEFTIQHQGMGVGDSHIWQNVVTNNRGNPDGGAEGFNTVRNQIGQNLTPMTISANSTLAAGATLIQGTLISNVPFPGDGTPLVDASKGSALFKIVFSGDPGVADAGQLTIDTLTLTPDNIGRVASPVTVPTQYYGATTNATVVVTGLTSAITTASTVCYADRDYMESARVVSVGGFSSGTQTITVALRYNHQAQAYVVQGSHSCTAIDIRANQYTGTFPGRQIIRIVGALDATHLLYSRIGAGRWLQALSGYATTRIVAPAGVTLTRNSSNVVSAPVTDPFLVLSKDFIIVSGCADTSFNILAAITSDNGSTVTWNTAGPAATTTCTNAVEIQSQLNGLSVREAQLFPAVEIVNTVDPVTFANNFNLTVEPNTNFQVTAGDHLEDQVYSEVFQGLDHNLINFQSQVSPATPDVIHFDQLGGQIPEGTTWYRVAFQDTPNNYLGHGGTKPVANVMLDMTNNEAPFLTIFQNIPTPDTAFVTFQGCSFGCADARSNFLLFRVPTQNGTYTETIHQDTGKMERVTGNSTNTLTVREEPADHIIILQTTGSGYIQTITTSDANSVVGGAGGTFSTIDQTSSATTTTIHGVSGDSHVIQTVSGWSSDVPITVPSCSGCGGGGGGGVISIDTLTGAFTFSGPGVSHTGNAYTFSGSGTGVSSFNTRAGAVVPVSGDYSFSLLSGNLGTTQGPSGLTGILKDTAGTLSAAVAADFPTLNQSTTGNAATATLATNSSAVGGVALAGLCQTGGSGCPAAGTGNTTSTSLVTNTIPKANGANSIINSGLTDDGTKLTYTGSGTANGWLIPEGTAITGVASSAALYPDSTLHRWMQNPNNIGALMIPGIATAGTAADCVKLAANGIDLVDAGAACGSGGSTAFSALTGSTNSTAAMVVGTGASLGVSGSGTINATSVNGNTFPASAGFTSGGVFYASSTSAAATSALLTNNVVMLGGGAGGAPKNSLATDSGTAFTYTGTAGFAGKYFVGTGTTAGFLFLPQGTTSTGDANCTTTTICIQAPAAVTSYSVTLAGAAATGFPFYTNSSSAIIETIVGTSGSGNVCLVTSCTMVTPTLGAATATSINKVTITAPTTSATLTLITGSTLTLNGAFNTQFTGSANATFTLPGASDTLAGIGATQTLTGKTLTSPVINGATGTGGTYTGAEQAPTLKGNAIGSFTAATIAAGAAAGTSPTIACTASHLCGPTNGTVTLTAGTATTTGALLTVTAGTAHTNLPDCTASVVLTASPFTALPYSWSYTTSVWTLNVGTAPTASTGYTITYTCPGI
jgi:hypothetical protein